MPPAEAAPFVFIANHRCLDFINTEMISGGTLVNLLGDFAALVAWLVQAQLLEAKHAPQVLRQWAGTPEGEHAVAQALALRAVLRQMVERLVQGQPILPSTIEAINAVLRHRVGYLQLARAPGGFTQHIHVEYREALQLLGPIAEAASDLLCYRDLALIKRCENPQCVLYFYDETKNHSRRWCSMQVCGNRQKAALHRLRTHQTRRSAKHKARQEGGGSS
jgi:predicted RNA-binding Zn ribbon-like protein